MNNVRAVTLYYAPLSKQCQGINENKNIFTQKPQNVRKKTGQGGTSSRFLSLAGSRGRAPCRVWGKAPTKRHQTTMQMSPPTPLTSAEQRSERSPRNVFSAAQVTKKAAPSCPCTRDLIPGQSALRSMSAARMAVALQTAMDGALPPPRCKGSSAGTAWEIAPFPS